MLVRNYQNCETYLEISDVRTALRDTPGHNNLLSLRFGGDNCVPEVILGWSLHSAAVEEPEISGFFFLLVGFGRRFLAFAVTLAFTLLISVLFLRFAVAFISASTSISFLV